MDCARRKSQLAIEYAYRIRERSPDTWVFWIHASNGARFEQGFRDIATFVKIPGRQTPKANIFQLVHDWLRDESKGPWTIVLDNVDDASFLKLPSLDREGAPTTTKGTYPRELMTCIPYCHHGSILITSRSKGAALELVEHANIIAIEPMNENDALRLFQNKLGQSDDEAYTIELAAALECMPLAIVQAAAYVVQRRPRYSVRKYLDEFRISDRRKASLLSLMGGELRRDAEAKNTILITWHISFNYIRKTRPSAADLLSLMSFCDRQGIPEFLLCGQGNHTQGAGERSRHDASDPRMRFEWVRRIIKVLRYKCGTRHQSSRTNHLDVGDEHNTDASDGEAIDSGSGSNSDSTQRRSNYGGIDEFDTDIITLRNFSFISVNEDGTIFEMHRLVQLATLEWLRAHEAYERWEHQFS
ncbi:hypothetical protein G3M48_008096 [Beauveria asiatica]|uniref:Uncharacterized protein n=1 Tax=Beauveria asiatica TaxID=1069075 RepID=A0AAW0RLC7_9HYPO